MFIKDTVHAIVQQLIERDIDFRYTATPETIILYHNGLEKITLHIVDTGDRPILYHTRRYALSDMNDIYDSLNA